jgi:hypothetical protein
LEVEISVETCGWEIRGQGDKGDKGDKGREIRGHDTYSQKDHRKGKPVHAGVGSLASYLVVTQTETFALGSRPAFLARQVPQD